MEQKLFTMIYDYSIHERLADNKFVEKVVDYLIDYYDIEDYVEKIIINDKEKINSKRITVGTYHCEKRMITINRANICYLSDITANGLAFDINSSYFLFNCQIVKVILHEFEHAMQNKTIYKIMRNKRLLNSNYELYLLYISQIFCDDSICDSIYDSKSNFKPNHRAYCKLYDYIPCERQAEITAIDKIIAVLSDEIIDLGMLCDYYYNNKYHEILKGYKVTTFKNIICPSEIFLKEIEKKSIWKSFEFYNSNREILLDECSQIYNLDTRIKCGFPISKREFNYYTDKMNGAYDRLIRTK